MGSRESPIFSMYVVNKSGGLIYNKSLTGTKLLLLVEPNSPYIPAVLQRIYELYTDFVLKNPFYETEQVIRCELFDEALENVSWSLSPTDALPVGGPFGVWMVLLFAGAFGTWAERNSKLGKQLSGALVATLMGMLLANLGVISHDTCEAKVVYKVLLPLAIPLLLLTADMRRVLTETGRLLPAFLLGALATVVGSVFAMLVFPLGQYLGEDGWKVAAALTARHIGGAINYMSVCQTLGVAPSTFSCGLAADDLILTLYFTSLYALAQAAQTPPPTCSSRRAHKPPSHHTRLGRSPPQRLPTAPPFPRPPR
ncbi:MAG: hypothetical protein WDW36_010067 [Sanguina aurantia]